MKKLRIESNELECAKCLLQFALDELEGHYGYLHIGDVGLDDGCYFCHGDGVAQPGRHIALDLIYLCLHY